MKRNRVIKKVSDSIGTRFINVERIFNRLFGFSNIDFKVFTTDDIDLFAKGMTLRDWKITHANGNIPYMEINEELLYTSMPILQGLDYRRNIDKNTHTIKPAYYDITTPGYAIKKTVVRMDRQDNGPSITYTIHVFIPGMDIPTQCVYFDKRRQDNFHITWWDKRTNDGESR